MSSEYFYIIANEVLILMLENNKYFTKAGYGELLKIIQDKFGIGKRQAQRYVTAARKEYRVIAKADAKKTFKQALIDRAYLINKFKVEDPKLALDAMKDREKLLDLYPAQSAKVEHKGEVNQKIVFVENLDE